MLPEEEKTKEEEIKLGEKEEDVYSKEGLEELRDDDEVDAAEEGFMEGYEFEHGKSLTRCASCDALLGRNFIENNVGGKIYRFCSPECADIFKKGKQ